MWGLWMTLHLNSFLTVYTRCPTDIATCNIGGTPGIRVWALIGFDNVVVAQSAGLRGLFGWKGPFQDIFESDIG